MTDGRSERRKWWSLHVRAPHTGIIFEKGSNGRHIGGKGRRKDRHGPRDTQPPFVIPGAAVAPGVVPAEKLPPRPAYLPRLRLLHSSIFNPSNTW